MGKACVSDLDICRLPMQQEMSKVRGEEEAEACGHFD